MVLGEFGQHIWLLGRVMYDQCESQHVNVYVSAASWLISGNVHAHMGAARGHTLPACVQAVLSARKLAQTRSSSPDCYPTNLKHNLVTYLLHRHTKCEGSPLPRCTPRLPSNAWKLPQLTPDVITPPPQRTSDSPLPRLKPRGGGGGGGGAVF